MYLAVQVGKFVKQVVRECCPSTTAPLLPTMTEWAGYLVPRDVLPPFYNIVVRTEQCINKHSCSDRINLGPNCSLDTGGVGGRRCSGQESSICCLVRYNERRLCH